MGAAGEAEAASHLERIFRYLRRRMPGNAVEFVLSARPVAVHRNTPLQLANANAPFPMSGKGAFFGQGLRPALLFSRQ